MLVGRSVVLVVRDRLHDKTAVYACDLSTANGLDVFPGTRKVKVWTKTAHFRSFAVPLAVAPRPSRNTVTLAA
jgi:hypothetical protein